MSDHSSSVWKQQLLQRHLLAVHRLYKQLQSVSTGCSDRGEDVLWRLTVNEMNSTFLTADSKTSSYSFSRTSVWFSAPACFARGFQLRHEVFLTSADVTLIHPSLERLRVSEWQTQPPWCWKLKVLTSVINCTVCIRDD